MPPRKKSKKKPPKKTGAKKRAAKKAVVIKQDPLLPPKKYKFDPWWRDQHDRQYYENAFFKPYFDALEPKLPDDYADPIFDEEQKLLTTDDEYWKNASPSNLNIPALFRFYKDTILPKMDKKVLVSMLIPTGDGNMNINCAVAMSTMFKPAHRIHIIQGHNIHVLRNDLVEMALRNEDCTHLFFLDSDVVMPPYGLMRLLRRSMEQDMDIVAGIYLMKAPPYAPLAIMRPQHIITGKKKYNYYFEITQELLNKVVPIDATGAGCLLIKREVIETIKPPWFNVNLQEHGLSAIGEDLHFFDTAMEHGFQPYMDLSVQCDHVMGGTAIPRIFFQGLAAIGPQSKVNIDTWNKNAVLQAQGLALYHTKEEMERKKKEKTQKSKTAEPAISPTSDETSLPIEVERVETLGDARSRTL